MEEKLNFIQSYMKENNITISQLAEQTGAAYRFISGISSGAIAEGRDHCYKMDNKKCKIFCKMILEVIGRKDMISDDMLAIASPDEMPEVITIEDIKETEENTLDEIQEMVNKYNEASEKCRIERQKLRTIKNIGNKNVKNQAQYELLLEDILNELSNIGKERYIQNKRDYIESSNDQVAPIADWHMGQIFDSPFGRFNSIIAKERVDKYYNRLINIKNTHKIENIHVVCLGDMIQGDMRDIFKETNEFPVNQQIINTVDLVADFLSRLSEEYKTVYVYSVVGNHSRRTSDKENSNINDYMDELVFELTARLLQHIENIKFIPYNDPVQAHFKIKNTNFIAVHGDRIKVMTEKGSGRLFSQSVRKLNIVSDCILAGHLHYPATQEFNGMKIIQVGCLPGSGDPYTNGMGLVSTPSQSSLVVNNEGIVCNYTIELD